MLRLESTAGTQRKAAECNYKFAVVHNYVVDKPHHVTLQKQKGKMGEGLLEIECRNVCVA